MSGNKQQFNLLLSFVAAVLIIMVLEYHFMREREIECKNFDNELCALRLNFANEEYDRFETPTANFTKPVAEDLLKGLRRIIEQTMRNQTLQRLLSHLESAKNQTLKSDNEFKISIEKKNG
eukprot:Seg1287.6 transcript_id=Seg1287.6/GoldUCD/mRNA.D3Y31 product="hypothetical protein" protein_id=Seg1287.6/GoldUCD/D3Y31